MTEPSYFLIERVLHNSVNVMKRQRTERNVPDYPLFHHNEVDEFSYLFQGFKYGNPEPWSLVPRHGRRAGAYGELSSRRPCAGLRRLRWPRRESLFYTGDVCFHNQTLSPKADFSGTQSDVMIRTTRGATEMPAGFTREAELQRFITTIREGLESGGVLVPVFALGRTQEMLAAIALAMEAGDLNRQPVYIGGLGACLPKSMTWSRRARPIDGRISISMRRWICRCWSSAIFAN